MKPATYDAINRALDWLDDAMETNQLQKAKDAVDEAAKELRRLLEREPVGETRDPRDFGSTKGMDDF